MIGRYSDHHIDTIRYGGYYTQDDIREIVKYAQSRHITIIPEIEMPGHALAALASYPEFSCTGGPFEVAKEWGVFDDVFCAGNENTFKFIEDVLTEVCNLFPGKYIHIGGDECPKTRWKTCSKCQKRMKDEGLKDEHELQSYFIRRIEKFLNSKGKQIIGWDEILEGGLAPNAAVMSWRGEQGGIEAANQQHNVVMSPGSYCYFDHYQGDPELEPIAIGGYTPVEKVYDYDPVPAELNDSLEKYILGAQGNVWTEYILNEAHVEYMAFPRMCALAEVLWTPKEKKNENDFFKRLNEHFTFLDQWKVNHSKSIFQIKLEFSAYQGKIVVMGKSNFPEKGILLRRTPLDSINSKQKDFILIKGDDGSTGPIFLKRSTLIEAKLEGYDFIAQQMIYINKSTATSIRFSSPPNKPYNANEESTLIDGIKADLPRKNNQWNAWQGEDVEMIIDLEQVQEISEVEIGYLNDISNWIWAPKEIVVYTSSNGKKYKNMGVITSYEIQNNTRQLMMSFKPTKTRYVKIKAINPGKIPTGNPGAGEDSWMFFDEVLID
jgi:hexosaminidase